jgi:hypothetical protein
MTMAETTTTDRLAEEERLAAEGYLFYYAQEASEFAQASSRAVAEATDHDTRVDDIAF